MKNGNKKIEIEIVYFEAQETMKRMTEVAEEEYENLFGQDKLDIKLRAMPPKQHMMLTEMEILIWV